MSIKFKKWNMFIYQELFTWRNRLPFAGCPSGCGFHAHKQALQGEELCTYRPYPVEYLNPVPVSVKTLCQQDVRISCWRKKVSTNVRGGNPQVTVTAKTLLMLWPPVRTQKYLWMQLAAADENFWTSSKDYIFQVCTVRTTTTKRENYRKVTSSTSVILKQTDAPTLL